MTSLNRVNVRLNIVDSSNVIAPSFEGSFKNEITFFGNSYKRITPPLKGFISSYKSTRVKIFENDRLTVDTTVAEFILDQMVFTFRVSDTMFLNGIKCKYDKEWGFYNYKFREGRSYKILVRAF